MRVTAASQKDIPVLVSLMNSAYRGDASKKGWTTEASIIDGDLRTDNAHLQGLMSEPGSAILKYTNEENEIEGCVFLQKREGKLYLGMLSVSPYLQAKGVGKALMLAAENYAVENALPDIFMRVISTRHELLSWYERKGYVRTGERQPFEDSRFGKAREPIEFLVLQKQL
jgi:ribosomal protein S18 acetylase RimI-like enzyme